MNRSSIHDKLAARRGLPEALLALSVLSVSTPWIQYILSAVERGGAEVRLLLSIVAAIGPATLFVIALIHCPLPRGHPGRLARWLAKERPEKDYFMILVATFALQAALTIIAWLDVHSLELTGTLLRFYLVLIPLNSAIVFGFTVMSAVAGPRTKMHAIRIVLGALLLLFSIMAMGEVGSTIST